VFPVCFEVEKSVGLKEMERLQCADSPPPEIAAFAAQSKSRRIRRLLDAFETRTSYEY